MIEALLITATFCFAVLLVSMGIYKVLVRSEPAGLLHLGIALLLLWRLY